MITCLSVTTNRPSLFAPKLSHRRAVLRPCRARKDDQPAGPGDDIAEELSRLINPAKRVRMNLELSWNVRSKQGSRPRVCEVCKGEKECECEFCHATGVMQIGDDLYCSDTGCQGCPVCKSTGELVLTKRWPNKGTAKFVCRPYAMMDQTQRCMQGYLACRHCQGTGFRASWLEGISGVE